MSQGSSRIFITDGNEHFQMFGFTQNRKDGSIYVSSPEFDSLKFIRFSEGAGKVVASPGDGKLSVHGSGMVGVRAHEGGHVPELVVKGGNVLLEPETGRWGVRHLFTALPAKPEFKPSSPAFNRGNDYSISMKGLSQFAIVFFAIPRARKLSVEIRASFHVDDLESVPPDSGFGSFNLPLHGIGWFAYKTKHMTKWAAETHISYHDGHLVPVLIGEGNGTCRVEFRVPTYVLNDGELAIAF